MKKLHALILAGMMGSASLVQAETDCSQVTEIKQCEHGSYSHVVAYFENGDSLQVLNYGKRDMANEISLIDEKRYDMVIQSITHGLEVCYDVRRNSSTMGGCGEINTGVVHSIRRPGANAGAESDS